METCWSSEVAAAAATSGSAAGAASSFFPFLPLRLSFAFSLLRNPGIVMVSEKGADGDKGVQVSIVIGSR